MAAFAIAAVGFTAARVVGPAVARAFGSSRAAQFEKANTALGRTSKHGEKPKGYFSRDDAGYKHAMDNARRLDAQGQQRFNRMAFYGTSAIIGASYAFKGAQER